MMTTNQVTTLQNSTFWPAIPAVHVSVYFYVYNGLYACIACILEAESEIDPAAPYASFTACSHANAVHVDAVKDSIALPINWHCAG